MNTIVDTSASRGKRSYATKDYLPGEVIPEQTPIRYFAQMYHISHACGGNVHYTSSATSTTRLCRAIRPIKAGEELTTTYDEEQNLKFTHQRRQHYLENYRFVCHCPRCDAPGDDTRQFDCFDPACRGVMMVCQPINKNKAYTGVEFVEPRLLPCTVCRRPASADYQKAQLELEANLPSIIQAFIREEQELTEKSRSGFMQGISLYFLRLDSKIQSAKLPLRHSLCLPVHQLLLRLAPSHQASGMIFEADSSLSSETLCRTHREKASKNYIQALEALTHGPSEQLLDVMRDEICYENVILGDKVMMGVCSLPPEAKFMLQDTLRMMLVLKGRDACAKGCTCRNDLDTYLLKTLQQLPVPVEVCDGQVCAFCEESPAKAALVLRRCGKCKQVCYCSSDCQKAHWKLHKKTCGGH